MSSAPGSSCLSVPVEHLDYSFIQSCSDLKHLEQILKVLRSGQEGVYPHLMAFCERHIEALNPRSRVLRKENGPATAACFSSEEWRTITEDLQTWERHMRMNEAELKRSPISGAAEGVPPVRSSNTVVQRRTSAAVNTVKTSCVPRPYTDWDRFDVDSECAEADERIRNTIHPECPELLQRVSSMGLTAQEKQALALREKDKGNEAFWSGDYEEAAAYYSRSLSLASSAAVFNNRAQAHIRLQCWSAALSDCEAVLQLEPDNVKALLRRATANKHLGRLQESHHDLRAVLQIEPQNKTALNLLKDEAKTDQAGQRCSTGRKILIEEVEEDEEQEGAEDEGGAKPDVGTEDSRITGDSCETLGVQTDSSSRGGGSAPEDTPSGHTQMMDERYRENLERNTKEFELLKDDGKVLFSSGCYQEAVDKYTQCLQLNPHACAVYTNRALCYIRLQLFTEARQDCDSALQIEPTNKKAFYRRALASKALKDYLCCRSDLQQVLRLDASVTEAQELLVEVTRLMEDKTRRSVPIAEVEDDDGDDDEGEVAPPSVLLQSSNAFEFGQTLSAARCHDDLLTCAELLRCVAPEHLPRLISTQLEPHNISFIIRTLNTHLLNTHPELVYRHLQQLRSTHTLTTVLMLFSSEDRHHLSQLLQNLRAVRSELFSPDDVTHLANSFTLSGPDAPPFP